MTLSVSDSKKGSVIRGEVQVGQVLFAPLDDAFDVLQRDITNVKDWAPDLVDGALLDNRYQPWEEGARRRVTLKKAPYTGCMVRETLSQRLKTASRGRLVFSYAPLDDSLSFSSLKLDSSQKKAKAMLCKQLTDPEAPSASESAEARAAHFLQPTVLRMTTTYSLSALTDTSTVLSSSSSGPASSGKTRCFCEIFLEYEISCETPGAHDEHLRYDHAVLREFLERYWVTGLADALATAVHARAHPSVVFTTGVAPSIALSQPTKSLNGALMVNGNVIGSAAPGSIPGRLRTEHNTHDEVSAELTVKAKTDAENKAAAAFHRLLVSWEGLAIDAGRNQLLLDQLVHELDAARHVTTAATALSSASERVRVIYEFEENKKL